MGAMHEIANRRPGAVRQSPGASSWSVQTLLLALVAVTMLPVVSLVAYADWRHYAQAREQAAQSVLNLAEVTANNTENFLEDARMMMGKLAARPGIRRADGQACDPIFASFKDLYPQFANFSQASIDGELICSTTRQPGDQRTPVADTAWFRSVVHARRFIVAPPYRGPVTGKIVSVLAHPVFGEDGQLVGSIQLPVDLVGFRPVVASNRLPPSTLITIVDSRGVIVARSVAPEKFVGTARLDSPIIRQVLTQRSGTTISSSVEGIERIYGFVPITGTDWIALSGIATEAVFHVARQSALWDAVGGGLTVVLATVLALALGRRITRPAAALRSAAQRVAAGSLATRAATDGPTELAQVALQFNAMLDAHAQQTRLLQASEAEFRLLFETSLEGILLTQADGQVLRANPAVCRLLERDESALQRGGLNSIIDAGDSRWQALFDERERCGSAVGEARCLRADGTQLECAVSSSVYVAADGERRAHLVLRDLSDRLQKEELRAAKEAAELASVQKSAFMARMSHELRTPLNAILGFGQLLGHEPEVQASAQARAMVGQVLTAGAHLLMLIDDVLDLSRIESGTLLLSLETVAVDALVAECVSLISPQATPRGVQVDVVRDGPPRWIRADRTRARQALINVLSNAVKYGPRDTPVQVRVDGNADAVRIAVRDQGPGLTVAQRRDLFKPFNRLGAEGSAVEGTGLGLVIVKHVLEAMGGRIDVDSEPGRGSCFTLCLLADTPPAAATPETVSPGQVDPPAVRDLADGPQTALLYIEDNPVNVELMRAVLRLRPGWRLSVAVDGASGLALALKSPPDLILLDLHLPDIDGQEVLRRLRDAGCRTPCIALSANAMPADVQRALDEGFDDYVVKPFVVSELLATIEGILAARPETQAAR